MTGRLRHRLIGDNRGVTVVEFALVAPVMLIGILGVFDLGFNMYTATLLQGAIHDAARDSTIEGADTHSVDAHVTDIVNDIAPNAHVTFKREFFKNFSDVGRPEDFTDSDGNGACDAGEPFVDVNGNGVWDTNRGTAGVGSARDAVLYTVTVNYLRPFPVAKLIGQDGRYTLVARTVLRNQPFNLQKDETSVRSCS